MSKKLPVVFAALGKATQESAKAESIEGRALSPPKACEEGCHSVNGWEEETTALHA